MKKLFLVLALVLSMFSLAFTSNASLSPISVTSFQNIDWQKGLTGEIYYSLPPNISLLYSYCVDKDAPLYVPHNYYAEIVPITGKVGRNEMDWLLKAAYLMDTYAYSKNGTLTWNNYTYTKEQTGAAVQLAIWDVINQKESVVAGYEGLFTLADHLVSTIPTTGLDSYASKYAVLDLYENPDKTGPLFQDLLTPVPIPPTVWLLGTGLIGIGLIRKRIHVSPK